MSKEEKFIQVEDAFIEFMEHLNTNLRISMRYHSTPHYYGIKEELYLSEAHVVQAIGDKPSQSLLELAQTTHRTKSAMSMMIRKLEKKGLVLKIRTQADNRRIALALTDKGRVVYDYHQRLDQVNYKSIFEKMDEIESISLEDLHTANKVLKSLVAIPERKLLVPDEE